MKKIILMAAVAAGALFTACDKTGNVTIKTDVDTIAYELGMAASPADMLPTFLVRMGSDSACVAEYLKGFKEGLALSDDAKSVAYELGKQHGMQTKQQMIASVSAQIFGEGSEETLDEALFLAGFLDMIEGKSRLVVDSVEITQQMAQMEQMAQAHPHINFIFAHPGEASYISRHIEIMKKCPNVYLDFSGTGVLRGAFRYSGRSSGHDCFRSCGSRLHHKGAGRCHCQEVQSEYA